MKKSAKAPAHLIPRAVVAELGVAMLEGSIKYGAHNWRDGKTAASTLYDAAQRHIESWWMGESTDPDSGLPHLVKAMANLTILRDSETRGCLLDDRQRENDPYPNLDIIVKNLTGDCKDEN